jgi:monovalent cation:H+ antiporter-2, CPA2 family
MPHEIDLIAILVAGFGLALVFGYIATLFKAPPLVGYLAAGILIGPTTPGFVGDPALAAQLAEIGVMLLMFGVGLHFSIKDLMAVKRVAIPGAILQILVATAVGMAVALVWGKPLMGALVYGVCLSVASTVVLLRTLEARGLLLTDDGKLAVGWLVVEDLVMVLVLVLLPVAATVLPALTNGDQASIALDVWLSIGVTLLKVLAFVVLMLVVGKRLLPWVLQRVAQTQSRELFNLAVIAVALGVAFLAAEVFDVSFALGAFFAGMMLRESDLSHRAAEESLPLRDAFAVLFFVSVGMLFDPMIVIKEPLALLVTVAIVMFVKTGVAVVFVLLMRRSLQSALTVSVSLAQIGEFSFILAGMGLSMKLITSEAYSVILAAAFVSIALNTALFGFIPKVAERLMLKFPSLS